MPLSLPAVREHFAERDLFSASQLEEFRGCSFRWFVRHELQPQAHDADREALETGGLVHEILERLYREPPSGSPRPRPGEVTAWQQRAQRLAGELAGAHALDGDGATARAARRRAEIMVCAYLERDAADESKLAPRPDLIEARFGYEDGEHPALTIGDPAPLGSPGGSLRACFRLRGKIDRIDVDASGALGLLRDYKTSTSATSGARLQDEGKLQLQLYAIAASELFGIEPIGAVYEPLGARDGRPRGILRKSAMELLDPNRFYRTDFLDDDDFDAKLDDARELAAELVGRIRDGDIRRDPIGGECPDWCECTPICRQERGAPLPDGEEE
jgi:ATP-dependent helicase/DNAse subunit B